jgi:hypothetical protein
MNLDPQIIDKLYVKYGYRQINESDNIRLFLYEKGRYYGADIIPLNEEADTLAQCIKIKSEYGEGGYAAQIKKYKDNESVATELYRSFFSYETTRKRIVNKYSNFIITQSKLNGNYRYEYINSPFRINSEIEGKNDLVDQIVNKFTIDRPQLIIIEASAGYGKTCSAFEILKKLLDCPYCENPLMTVLSRNRGANIFRYILLDEIDREYPTLDSNLVTHEILTGRIPLIIDGFDELLNKSEIVKSEKDKVFGEVETMLDTIGSLLKGKARIILTSRKTAIFAGDEFQTWLLKWNCAFDVTRYSIEIPRIKDWLSQRKLDLIKQAQIPVEYIANPVLLTYLRNLDEITFIKHIEEPEFIIKKYFNSLHEREITRQDLKISPDDQYKIFKNVVRLLIKIDQGTEERSFFKEIILDENKEILGNAIKLYPSDKNIEWLADKLINHALLDRKGKDENEIGFINDFVFGTFIGEIISETPVAEIGKLFSPYMIEIGATAYRVQNSQNKESLWNKIDALKERFENDTLFTFDITLKGKLERSFEQTIFQSIQIFKIQFSDNHLIKSSVFINSKFKNCTFYPNIFDSVSFIDCTFEDCSITGISYINDYKNSYTIKCHQKNCNVLSFQSSNDEELHSDSNIELENTILKELYLLEKKFKSQRLLQLMKRFNKTDHKIVARLINKLVDEKIIKVVGSDMFIEINKTHIVKKRINKL